MNLMKKLMKTVDLWIPDERQISLDKGHEFEKYVIKLFYLKKEYFSIANWTSYNSDKKTGNKIESDRSPDFLIRYKPTNELFAVEAKWRADTFYNRKIHDEVIKWAEPYQIKNYQKYSKQYNIPVFIVIGLDGKPRYPDHVYCIPLEIVKYPEIFPSIFEKYERKPKDKPFFWDLKNKKLS